MESKTPSKTKMNLYKPCILEQYAVRGTVLKLVSGYGVIGLVAGRWVARQEDMEPLVADVGLDPALRALAEGYGHDFYAVVQRG